MGLTKTLSLWCVFCPSCFTFEGGGWLWLHKGSQLNGRKKDIPYFYSPFPLTLSSSYFVICNLFITVFFCLPLCHSISVFSFYLHFASLYRVSYPSNPLTLRKRHSRLGLISFFRPASELVQHARLYLFFTHERQRNLEEFGNHLVWAFFLHNFINLFHWRNQNTVFNARCGNPFSSHVQTS